MATRGIASPGCGVVGEQAVGQCGEPEFELCLTGNIGQLVDHAGREREVVGRQAGEGAEPCGPVGALRLLTVARQFPGDEAGGVDQRGTDCADASPERQRDARPQYIGDGSSASQRGDL